MTTLTQKSQVTIPKKIRELVGLSPGEEVEFEVKESNIILHKKRKTEVWDIYKGYLGKGNVDEIMRELRGE